MMAGHSCGNSFKAKKIPEWVINLCRIASYYWTMVLLFKEGLCCLEYLDTTLHWTWLLPLGTTLLWNKLSWVCIDSITALMSNYHHGCLISIPLSLILPGNCWKSPKGPPIWGKGVNKVRYLISQVNSKMRQLKNGLSCKLIPLENDSF